MTTRRVELVRIEKPVYGGSCLTRLHGKTIFVPFTIPGELARIRIAQDKRNFAFAEVEEISSPSALRVAPECPSFGACGGCNYQHADYQTQLAWKEAILRETLERAGVPVPRQVDVLQREPWYYRNRIRLAVDAQGRPGYRGRRSHDLVPVEQCPIAAHLLVRAAKAIQETLLPVKRTLRIGEISLFCNADESALLVSLRAKGFSKPKLGDFAESLKESSPELRGVELVPETSGATGTRAVACWGEPFLQYHAAGVDYRVDNGAFFQVNRWLVDDLVRLVTQGKTGSLAWDLFAGVGLFARQLASRFQSVLAVESAPASIAALQANLAGTSGQAVQADTLSFLRRPVQSARPDCIVVDPPRTGLGAEVTRRLSDLEAPSLIYISCDPATLARDLRALIAGGYAIESLTLVDLFPQTLHMETVLHLHRS